MASEIGNKALLRRIGEFFNVVDVKQAPGLLHTDEIHPVLSIPFGAGEEVQTQRAYYGPYTGGAARALIQCNVIANTPDIHGGFEFAGGPLPSDGRIWRVDSLNFNIAIDAADATSYAGDAFTIWLYRMPAGANDWSAFTIRIFPISTLHRAHVIQAGALVYEWNFPGSYYRWGDPGPAGVRNAAGDWNGLVHSNRRIRFSPSETDQTGLALMLRMRSAANFPSSMTALVQVVGRWVPDNGSGVVPAK